MYFITWFHHCDILFKPVLEWWQLPHFPTKTMLIPACALYRVLIKSRTWSGPPLRIYSSLLLTYNALGYFSSPPLSKKGGRVRWIVWTLLRPKEWLHSYLWVFFFLFFQNCCQILRVCLSTYCREIRKCFRRLVELCNEVSTCSSKHHQVQQRVRSKSVGSMNWCTCRLPGCPQSWHYFIFTILDWQCLQEGQNNSDTQKQGHIFYRDVLFERGRGGQSCQFVSSWNTWVSSLVLCCNSIW